MVLPILWYQSKQSAGSSQLIVPATTHADAERLAANKSATPASATGSAHDQSRSHETAPAPTRQPAKKPATSCTVFFNCSPAFCSNGSFLHRVSSSDNTVLVKFPVITAVEGAPGMARRKRANWQAIAETAIMAIRPAMNPRGLPAGSKMTLKIRMQQSRRN